MKIKVYSTNKNMNIAGEFSGCGALEQAREFAKSMSFLTALSLDTGKRQEVYSKGCLESVSDWDFSDKYFGETDAICFIAKHSGMTISDVARANPANLEKAVKAARIKLHPDNQKTGNHENFVRLERAYKILKGGENYD